MNRFPVEFKMERGNVIREKLRWGVIGAGGIADRRTIPGMLLARNAELTRCV